MAMHVQPRVRGHAPAVFHKPVHLCRIRCHVVGDEKPQVAHGPRRGQLRLGRDAHHVHAKRTRLLDAPGLALRLDDRHCRRTRLGQGGQALRFVAGRLLGRLAHVGFVFWRKPAHGAVVEESVRFLAQIDDGERSGQGAREVVEPGGVEFRAAGQAQFRACRVALGAAVGQAEVDGQGLPGRIVVDEHGTVRAGAGLGGAQDREEKGAGEQPGQESGGAQRRHGGLLGVAATGRGRGDALWVKARPRRVNGERRYRAKRSPGTASMHPSSRQCSAKSTRLALADASRS